MQKPDFIVSDTHLGAVPATTERAFVRFLEHVGSAANTLIINGDLFDFWFEWGEVIPARHFRVVAALADVVDAGVPITLIGGNHDAWGGKFLREEVGLTVHDGILRTVLGGRSSLLAHGDGLGKGDLKYRALKAVIRSRPAIWGFRALHPDIAMGIADRVSKTQEHAVNDRSSRGRAEFLETWGRAQLYDDKSLQLVSCGHAHEPTLIEVEPGRYYINSGDWLRHYTYVTVAEGSAPQLLSWTS